MTDQLVLIDIEDAPAAWQLDAATRELGRLGVARARAALRAAEQSDRRGIVPDDGLSAAA